MKMFLDDIRNPPDNSWSVVRSYDEAVKFVQEFGCCSVMSFDHDLGDEHAKTGYDFVKWLCEQDMDHRIIPDDFVYTVHSANTPGRVNIDSYLRGYLAQR